MHKKKNTVFNNDIFNREKLFELNDVNTTILEKVDFPKIIMTPKGYIGLVIGRNKFGTKVFIYEDIVTTILPNKQIVKVIDTEVILTIDKLRNIKTEKNYGQYADISPKSINTQKKKRRKSRKNSHDLLDNSAFEKPITKQRKKEDKNEPKNNRSRAKKSIRKKTKKGRPKKITEKNKSNKSSRQKNRKSKKI